MFKLVLNKEDQEDYEQEMLIKNWLKESGQQDDFEFKSINRKGNIKHVGDVGSFSLDQRISSEDGYSLFSEIIEGDKDIDFLTEEEEINELGVIGCLESLLMILKIKKETRIWAIKTYRSNLSGPKLSI